MTRLRSILCAALLVPMIPTLRAQSDLCGGAPLIACGSTVTGSTAAFTADVAPFCGTGNGTGGGVWYRFTGTGNGITASLCGSAFDTRLRVYAGTCGALTCTAGNDDFCGLQSQVTWTSTNAVTYFILVHGFGAAAGAYTLTVTCAPPPVPMCYASTVTPYVADPFTGTAVTLTDDVHSAVVPIGFPFCYNGASYSQCVISSNNYVSFNTTVAGLYSPWVTQAVPTLTPTEVRNSVLNPWQDIDPGVGGTVRYQTLGTAPNRRFVVSYLNVPMFSCNSQLYTSQTILYEGTNCIASFITSKPVCTTWNNGNAVHALHGSAGTSATVVGGRNNTQWTASAQGMFFVPTCAPCSTATTAQCLAMVLPVELLHFRGRDAGGRVVLEWATASELNTLRFEVERSADAQVFTPLAALDAAGQSTTVIPYAVEDPAPMPGITYYRLRTVDLDGVETLSEVVPVAVAPVGRPLVHPNPAQDVVNVQLPGSVAAGAQVLVRDIQGRPVRVFRVEGLGGGLVIEGLAPGTYLLEVPVLGPVGVTTFTVH